MKKKVKLRIKQLIVAIKYGWFWFEYKVIRREKVRRGTWLIAERGYEARDNGYVFYEYMVKNHPEADFWYVIDKKSSDLARVKNEGRIVHLGSRKHFELFLSAEYLLSTHIMGYSPEFRMFNKLDKKGLAWIPGKRIYLNHGIEKDDVGGLKKDNIKVDLFVCGAKPQYDYELKVLGHPEGVLQYTGMPRYDNLKNNLKRQIVIMPTWRMWLFYCNGIERFKETDYFKRWDKLFKNEELIKWLEQNDFEVVFYPHYEIQPYIEAFSDYNKRIKIADFDHYDVQTLLNESVMMVTDFSSVAFDFAYLEKPILYYQFDKKKHEKEHFGKGYFDYERDGFGEVVFDGDELIEKMKEYGRRKFKMRELYKKRRDKWFVYSDRKNSERVYEATLKAKNHYSRRNNNVK